MSVTLLERQLDFEREFRGEILMPSGLDALEQMGLREAVARVRQSCPSSVEVFANGRSILRVQLEPELFGGRPPVTMSQPALLEMLVAEAGRSSVVRTRWGRAAALRAFGEFAFGVTEVRLAV